ncbi:hypothetical protein ACSBR2_005105 [Camellia fascicularis]
MSEKSISENRMLVFVPPHPLVKHWVAVLRNEQTPCPIFKNAMAELGRLLMYEASRDWLIVPILRAGLALAEHASSTDMVNWDHWWKTLKCIKFSGQV